MFFFTINSLLDRACAASAFYYKQFAWEHLCCFYYCVIVLHSTINNSFLNACAVFFYKQFAWRRSCCFYYSIIVFYSTIKRVLPCAFYYKQFALLHSLLQTDNVFYSVTSVPLCIYSSLMWYLWERHFLSWALSRHSLLSSCQPRRQSPCPPTLPELNSTNTNILHTNWQTHQKHPALCLQSIDSSLLAKLN